MAAVATVATQSTHALEGATFDVESAGPTATGPDATIGATATMVE